MRRAVAELGITYPVALDNNYAIWQGFDNRFWPAHYFIDGLGRIRAHHFGEGDYSASEQIIRQLLTEAGITNLPAGGSGVSAATGAQAAPDDADMRSPETYLGYGRTQNFASEAAVLPDAPKTYAAPGALVLNQWALAGSWIVHKNEIALAHAPGAIVFRFHARDLHLVVGPGTDGKPIRFRVTLDGAAPAANHGVDIDASGNGIIEEQRLYQLIRQSDAVREHTFSIEFLDDGVQAYARHIRIIVAAHSVTGGPTVHQYPLGLPLAEAVDRACVRERDSAQTLAPKASPRCWPVDQGARRAARRADIRGEILAAARLLRACR